MRPGTCSLTDEQLRIAESEGRAKVEARAGTGKTSTLLEYARRHQRASILYVVFNRAVSVDARSKFPANTRVTTAHSLAFKGLGLGLGQVTGSFDVSDVIEALGLTRGDGRRRRLLARAGHELFTFYCNSAAGKPAMAVGPLLLHMGRTGLANFIRTNEAAVVKVAVAICDLMESGILKLTHDFYVKKYAMTVGPAAVANYRVILADEAQDHSECVSDLLTNSPGSTVLVGDSLQQIYGWRFAVNTLAKIQGYPLFSLTRSFRFGQEIAEGVTRVVHAISGVRLSLTGAGGPGCVQVYGTEQPDLVAGTAYLSRSNGPLLRLADKAVHAGWSIYVEGGVESFQFETMFDLLHLLKGHAPQARNALLRCFNSLAEYEEYCSDVDDQSALALVSVVKDYRDELFDLKVRLERGTAARKGEAMAIFSTAHRAKGLEFDRVALLDTFASELLAGGRPFDPNDWRMQEEVNLAYVAMTRAKRSLSIPRRLAEAASGRPAACNDTDRILDHVEFESESESPKEESMGSEVQGMGMERDQRLTGTGAEATIRCNKRVPLRLPRFERLTPDEQLPLATKPLDQSYIVTGGPGTGKTILAIYRAKQLVDRAASHGRSNAVKLLVYNRTLWKFLETALTDLKVPENTVSPWIRFFYSFYLKQTGEKVPEVKPYFPDWDLVEDRLLHEASTVFEHVVLDEAQDLPLPLMKILKRLSKAMTIYYDQHQSIHGREDAPKSVADVVAALDLHGRRYSLSKNYRNTAEIAAVAHLFFTGDGDLIPADSALHGEKPLALACTDHQAIAERVVSFWATRPEWVVGVLVPHKDLAKLVTEEIRVQVTRRGGAAECVQLFLAGKEDLDFGFNGIKVLTYMSAKGLEFDAVFLPDVDREYQTWNALSRWNQLHVACSRPRSHLVLMYSGTNPDSPILQKMQENRDLFRWIEVSASEESF